jgi:hypothetical protein
VPNVSLRILTRLKIFGFCGVFTIGEKIWENQAESISLSVLKASIFTNWVQQVLNTESRPVGR